jgi:RNA polymerase primary sigma factor
MLQDDWGDFITSAHINGLLTKARRLGIPKKQEERDMVALAQAGDTHAREQLLIRHSPFVVTVVKKYRNRGVECTDLFNLGMIGLDTAITKFDMEKYPHRLISYGVWWSRQEMIRSIQDSARTVRLPAGRHVQVQKLAKMSKLAKQAGVSLDIEKARKALKLTKGAMEDLLPWIDDTRSMDAETHQHQGRPGGSHDDREFGDLIGFTPNDDVADESEYQHFFEMMGASKFLCEREKRVLIQRHLHGRTLDDIATDYGVCRERIRQVEYYALQKMKKIVQKHDRVNRISRGDRVAMLSMGG